ncbi:MAG: 50S ribosomal protein L6 [Planctomycetota bacterium]|nr:50S ribosomal protein L6 [Planctomycetota bacterium]
MSRIGKQPVTWKSGTKVSFADGVLTVESGNGKLSQDTASSVAITIDDDARTATVSRVEETREARAMHGLYRSLFANMVEGLEDGFVKKLEIHGVGYNAAVQGKSLVLNVGYNAPIELSIPEGITCEAPQPTVLSVSGVDKQLVGQFAAEIRAVRKPEPYKGKGIRYADEYVRRKVGKALGAE